MKFPYVKVISVAPLKNYRLKVSLSNGKEGVYDVSPFLERGGVFRKLHDPEYFARVKVVFSGVGWPGKNAPDISPFSIDDNIRLSPKKKTVRRVSRTKPSTARRTAAKIVPRKKRAY